MNFKDFKNGDGDSFWRTRVVGCLALLGFMLYQIVTGIAHAQTPGTVTISATPASGTGTVTPTVTWSTTPAATSCTASGAWTGTKAASGSAVQAAITANSTYTLTCAWPGVVQTATVNFTAPTQNTDNSPLTNLAGYRLLYGTSATNLNLSKSYTDPTATSVQIQPAAAGSYTAVLRAVSATGAESDNSNTTTFTVAAPAVTASNSASVTVTAKPNPPTNVTATVALALNIPLDSHDGFNRTLAMSVTSSGPGVPVGFVKIATPTVGDPLFTWRGQSWCHFLPAHPVTGASNIEWIKGVSTSTDAAAPCA